MNTGIVLNASPVFVRSIILTMSVNLYMSCPIVLHILIKMINSKSDTKRSI